LYRYSKAKFDKSARRLEVTLPVKPGEEAPAEPYSEPSLVEEVEEEEDGFAKIESPRPATKVDASPAAAAAAPAAAAAVGKGTTGGCKVAGKKGAMGGDLDDEYVMVDKDEARAAASAAAAVAAAAAFEGSGETENQR
jgi:dynein assembly factor 2